MPEWPLLNRSLFLILITQQENQLTANLVKSTFRRDKAIGFKQTDCFF